MKGHLLGSDEDNIVGRATYRWLEGGFFLQQDGGSFSGGWRPNPGADETVNVPYDIAGTRVGESVSRRSPAGAP